MKPVVSPVAIDYLGESLAASGWNVDVLDLALIDDWESALDDYFSVAAPIAAALTVRNLDDCFLASQDFCIADVRAVIAHIRAESRVPIVAGGSGFSIAPERALDYVGADFGIAGDGEAALPHLLESIAVGVQPSSIPGLVWKEDGCIRRSKPPFARAESLKALSRRRVDNLRYFQEGGQVGIETKRGCPMGCIYCAERESKGSRVRLKPAPDVADEFTYLLDVGITHFHLCDSEFNIPPEHAAAVCRELISRGLNGRVHWYTYASPAPFPAGLARLMKEAGCAGIDFGADSASNRILENLGRVFSRADLAKAAKLSHQAGLTFMFDLLLGGPGETRETIKETMAFMEQARPSRVGLACGMRVYPGTRLAASLSALDHDERSRCLKGKVEGNEDFFEPVFYVSPELGDDLTGYVRSLAKGDPMYFLPGQAEPDSDYNYNDNAILIDAIKKGYRGAYWDILRRLQEGRRP